MSLLSRTAGKVLETTAARRVLFLSGLAGVVMGALMLFAGVQASASTDFTSFSAPLTGASDFAVNFPNVPFTPGPVGPIGLLDDGTNFFVSDYANSLLYKFPLTGGNASSVPSADDNLHDIAVVNGTYYGTSRSPAAVVTFNPVTLALGSTVIPLPCAGLGIAGDPVTGNLLVDTNCGVFRISNPTSSPTVKRFSRSRNGFDGDAYSADGQALWAADDTNDTVVEFGRRGKVLATIADPDGPDGIVFAQPNTVLGNVDVSNNVFVNNNDGTITRIDTNNFNQTSIVARGGTRGDYGIAGPDGCFYVTQSDRVEQVAPCFFQSTGPTTTTTTTTTTPPPTTTTTTTTPPPTTTTTSTTPAPTTSTTGPTTTTTTTAGDTPTSTVAFSPTSPAQDSPTDTPPAGAVAASSGSLAFTGDGRGVQWTAFAGVALALIGALVLMLTGTRWYSRLCTWLLGR